jgi:hypothetical protein
VIYRADNCPTGTIAFCNGIEIDGAVMADTGNGVIEYIPGRPKVKKPERDRIYTRKVYGNVTVKFPDGTDPLWVLMHDYQ